jgi:hypothetical protein
VIETPLVVRMARPVCAFGGFKDGEKIWHEVAVRDGQAVGQGADPHGKTAAGVSADGRVLVLLVADNYNPGVSIGLSAEDAGQVLVAAGAYRAVFLDGGGSCTLVGRDADGTAAVLNRPAGLQNRPGTLRYVGHNLGLTGLRRTSEPLPVLADWEAPVLVRVWNEAVVWGRAYPWRAALLGVIVGAALLGLVRVWWRRHRHGRPEPEGGR